MDHDASDDASANTAPVGCAALTEGSFEMECNANEQ